MQTLLIEDSEQQAFRSLYDDRPARMPELHVGDQMPIVIGLVERVAPWRIFDSRIFNPQAIAADTSFRIAISGDAQLPVAGSGTLTFTNGTSEETGPIPFDATGDDVETALNALPLIEATGGVTVTGLNGFFKIVFNEPGAREILAGNPGGLVPLSVYDIRRAVAGNSVTQEIQTLRVLQNAGAATIIDSAGDSAAIAIATVQAGGVGVNAQYRVTLSGEIYKGSWTFAKTNPGGAATSQAIQWNDSAAEIQTKIAAMTGIGTGNVSVTEEEGGVYLIEFIGSLAATAISGAAVNGTNLTAISTLSGVLDLTVPGADYLLNDIDGNPVEERVVRLEVEKIEGSAMPTKILNVAVMLRRPVMEAASAIPTSDLLGLYYTKAQIDAMSGDSPVITVSSTGTTDLAPADPFHQWFQKVIAQAGAGAYTRKFTIDNSQAMAGAVFRIYLEIAASANPTIEIHDNTAGGTLLETITGDADNPSYFLFEAEFDNSSKTWSKLSSQYLT